MIQLPVTRSGNSDYDLTIEGVTYTFQYRYNTRNKRIFLNILRESVPLLMGMRLIENGTPNEIYANKEAPQGVLFVAKATTEEDFSTLGNLGIDLPFNLVYFSELEFETIINLPESEVFNAFST